MATFLRNLRIDARGHIREVEVYNEYHEWPNDLWFKLDGTLVPGPANPVVAIQLRIDARGHVREVGMSLSTEEPPYFLLRWYKLDGTWTVMSWPQLYGVINLRIDARGHVREVQMSNMNWYKLNGELVA